MSKKQERSERTMPDLWLMVHYKQSLLFSYTFKSHALTTQNTNQFEQVDPSILENLSADGRRLFEKNTTKSSFRSNIEQQLEVTTQSDAPSEVTIKAVCELAKLLNKKEEEG